MDESMDEPAGDPMSDQVLDGNAAAGALAEAFGADLTPIPSRCAHCGAISSLAELRAYVRAPGIVLRCRVCGQVVLRVVVTETATYVDARGAAFMRFDRG